MSDTICPICDYALELPEMVMVAGVTGVQRPTVDSLKALETTEQEMFLHMAGHEVREWVAELRRADEYIDQMLTRIKELEAEVEDLRRPRLPDTRALDAIVADSLGRAPQPPVDPEQTLIPLIPTSQRPEGAVGRKT